MMQLVTFTCSPEQALDESYLLLEIKKHLNFSSKKQLFFRWKKRSLDARNRTIKVNCSFEVSEEVLPNLLPDFDFKNVGNEKPIHIIGAGPAGLFAALECLLLGLKPVLFERGKEVRARRRDLAQLNKEGLVNPESNYCFGEGGAGTYSDGKLYTRSKKRGDVDRILQLLVYFGAHENILVEAHPHIGTNKLPQIIEKIRQFIIEKGGEVHFESKLTDLKVDSKTITSFEINASQWIETDSLILATGHSARDIFYLLQKHKIRIEAKPFAIGVRVEHQQSFIDQLQYHNQLSGELLPPASYSLVSQIDGRGVYSFCMCPGGIIAPCATNDGEVVTNGWSPSKRNNPYANSGIVVSIDPSDFPNFKTNPLVCLEFQKMIEEKAWAAAGKNQKVPAQTLKDFIDRKKSTLFPESSYYVGLTSVEMDDIFPAFVVDRLRKGFKEFDKKMPGFISQQAIVHAPESRTSSPVLIPRNHETMEHVDINGLYPCAEGAGYAGGIVSAAIDGAKCVQAIHNKISK